MITLEFESYYMITVYTPNAQAGLNRLDFRMEWEEAFRAYVAALDHNKPVVMCGDLNVAHQEIDLKNPKQNRRNAGFTDEEREKFGMMLDSGFTDVFRRLYPDKTGAYTWWSCQFNARSRNAGWKIDYFVVSERLMPMVNDSQILDHIMGSDHCPVLLELNLDEGKK